MRPAVDPNQGHTPGPRTPLAFRVALAFLTAAFVVVGGYVVIQGGSGDPPPPRAAGTDVDERTGPSVAATGGADTTTSSIESTTTTSIVATTSLPQSSDPPPLGERPVIPATETQPEAKQLAADIAYSLTTYEAGDDHLERLGVLQNRQGLDTLAEASAPLTHPGYWSRGEVVYAQLGGMGNERVSVMVTTRQTVGSGSGTEFSVVRTMDIRLARGKAGWEFDFLNSAGGTFDNLVDLSAAHAVAGDPRIVMPDSARLDILDGRISPTLLDVMADLADQTPYEVVVLATGHPQNVFETDRVSHHTVGQAVDINRIGTELVIDDRDPGSVARATVEWLYDHPDVGQVGSPWDIDGEQSRRSFTDEVHQDHIHLAVDD